MSSQQDRSDSYKIPINQNPNFPDDNKRTLSVQGATEIVGAGNDVKGNAGKDEHVSLQVHQQHHHLHQTKLESEPMLLQCFL